MCLTETQLRVALKLAMMTNDQDRKDAIRVILGEIPRLNKKAGEEATEEEMIGILRKLRKNELQVIGDGKPTTFLEIVEFYLPQMMSKDEIFKHITDNVDLSQFKNKMQAMGPIMKDLKGKADGNDVKEVLMSAWC